jgi:hypothetical protein
MCIIERLDLGPRNVAQITFAPSPPARHRRA